MNTRDASAELATLRARLTTATEKLSRVAKVLSLSAELLGPNASRMLAVQHGLRFAGRACNETISLLS